MNKRLYQYNKTFTAFLSLAFLMICLDGYAQQKQISSPIVAEIYSEKVGVPGSATISLPIKVNHFDGNNLKSFTLKWDPSVVTFIKVERLGAKGMTMDGFNTAQAGRGILTFSPKEKSNALKDGSVLFALKFKAIGNAYKNTEINAVGQNLPIGSISVAKDQSSASGIKANIVSAYPNPFSNETRITYFLLQNGEVNVSITDLNGRVLKKWSENKTAGSQELVWNGTNSSGNMLPKGVYLVTLKYSGITKTIKLFKTE